MRILSILNSTTVIRSADGNRRNQLGVRYSPCPRVSSCLLPAPIWWLHAQSPGDKTPTRGTFDLCSVTIPYVNTPGQHAAPLQSSRYSRHWCLWTFRTKKLGGVTACYVWVGWLVKFYLPLSTVSSYIGEDEDDMIMITRNNCIEGLF